MNQVKVTRKTKKELEQTVAAYAESEGFPTGEVRQEIKGFMKGASSMLLVDALSKDELGLVENNPILLALKDLSIERCGQSSKNYFQNKGKKNG